MSTVFYVGPNQDFETLDPVIIKIRVLLNIRIRNTADENAYLAHFPPFHRDLHSNVFLSSVSLSTPGFLDYIVSLYALRTCGILHVRKNVRFDA